MILKIDTTDSGKVMVELVDSKVKHHDMLVETQKVGSQVLLPMIIKLLKKNKLKFSDIASIEVNAGPGSFTGTRVGVAVANALGFALDIPIIGSPRPPREAGEAGKRGKIVVPVYDRSKFDQ